MDEILAAADRPAADSARLAAARPLLPAAVRTIRRWLATLDHNDPTALGVALLAASSVEALDRWAGADALGAPGAVAAAAAPSPVGVEDASTETVERASLTLGLLRDLYRI